MYILHVTQHRWRISKGKQIIFSGIGNAQTALAIARVFGVVLSEFNNKEVLKAA